MVLARLIAQISERVLLADGVDAPDIRKRLQPKNYLDCRPSPILKVFDSISQ